MDLLFIVLRSMTSKACWNAFRDVINADLFTNAQACAIYTHLSNVHSDSTEDVSLEDLRLDVLSTYTQESEHRDALMELVASLADVPLRTPSRLRRYVHQFADRELGLQAAEYILAHASSATYDASVAADLLNRAVEVRSTVDSSVECLSDPVFRTQEEMRPGLVPLNCSKKMTKDLNGGVANGELLLYVGGPGVGKTNFMWHDCVGAAMLGKNVLGVTLEINTRKCRQRCYSSLTHIKSMDQFYQRSLIERAVAAKPGEIYLKNLSARKPSVDDLYALITRMRQRGQSVDLLMVDYAKLLMATGLSKTDNKYHAYESIIVNLRGMLEDLQIPGISAWQPTRDVCKIEVLRQDNVGECWAVVQHADAVMGLNQNAENKAMNVLRLGCMKQREGSVWPMHYLHYDAERMIIHDMDEETEDVQTRVLGAGDRPRNYGDGTLPEESK